MRRETKELLNEKAMAQHISIDFYNVLEREQVQAELEIPWKFGMSDKHLYRADKISKCP